VTDWPPSQLAMTHWPAPLSLRRRSFIGLGLIGGLSALAGFPALAAGGSVKRTGHFGRAKNVLVLLEQGGLSHMDTWDPKPDVVAEHRSPYKPIATNVPGMQFTELLKKTARHADKLAVVRSMHHKTNVANGHPLGTQYEMPDMGSVVAHTLGSPCRYLPPYIMVPGNHEQAAMTRTGFLPAGHAPFKTTGRDLSDPAWRVPNLSLLTGIDERRFRDRRDLLSNLNVGLPPAGTGVKAMAAFSDQAENLLTNPKTRDAFDLQSETDAIKDLYGRGHRGQCYLLGRKLVEAGVRFVTVDVREPQTAKTPGGFNMNWDHHDHIYVNGSCGTIRDKAGGEGRYGIGTWPMMGSTDHALAGLLEDMHQRGLLQETLVCFVTEFGRTPHLNKFQGRDHWVNAYSIAFAGAGIPGGQVIGATDKEGGYVVDRPLTPEDYAATVYEFLGLDREKPLYTPEDRPIFLAKTGEVIKELI
jgi:hypothetical protein